MQSLTVFDNILHESKIDMRVQYMIEVMFAVRKDGFKDHPIIPEGLDLSGRGRPIYSYVAFRR